MSDSPATSSFAYGVVSVVSLAMAYMPSPYPCLECSRMHDGRRMMSEMTTRSPMVEMATRSPMVGTPKSLV